MQLLPNSASITYGGICKYYTNEMYKEVLKKIPTQNLDLFVFCLKVVI